MTFFRFAGSLCPRDAFRDGEDSLSPLSHRCLPHCQQTRCPQTHLLLTHSTGDQQGSRDPIYSTLFLYSLVPRLLGYEATLGIALHYTIQYR